MKQHDPYGPLLLELSDINDADTDELLRDSLRKSQEFVKKLRRAYRDSPSNVDFSCPNTRAAYLLAYYPHYIELLYRVLSTSPQELLSSYFSHRKLRACFFGAGPAPEVIGWIMYLNECQPQVKRATAYLLDLFSDEWHKGQEITRYHLSPRYWWNGRLITVPLKFDLWKSGGEWEPRVDRAIKISNFFVMQNCLNDLLGQPQELLENILVLFERIEPGSLIVIADMNLPEVRDFMRTLEQEFEARGLGRVICRVQGKSKQYQANIRIPEIIEEELLTGEDDLIPRKNINYRFSVLARENREDDEMPF